jgi:hypothetical protein
MKHWLLFLTGVHHGFPQSSQAILAYYLETGQVMTAFFQFNVQKTLPHTTLTKNRKYRNEIFRNVTRVEIRNTVTANELHIFNLSHRFQKSNSNLNNNL